MGLWSWKCPHCSHSILIHHRTSAGINDWMGVAAVLPPHGEPFVISNYEGYGIHGEGNGSTDDDCVIVHEACWEVAGRPAYSDYAATSSWAEDQGFFFDLEEHDLIDPRITDPETRERLLVEGRAARERRMHNRLAADAATMVQTPQKYWDAEEREEPWRRRYRVGINTHRDGAGSIVDRLTDERTKMEGSIEQLEAEAAALWARWIESDELKALLAHHRSLQDAQTTQLAERLQKEGRYSVEVRRVPGDQIVGGFLSGRGPLRREVYSVLDQLTYDEVAMIDLPYAGLEAMTYSHDPRDGVGVGWAERAQKLQAAADQSRIMAQEVATKLNSQWAEEGHPIPWGRIRELANE